MFPPIAPAPPAVDRRIVLLDDPRGMPSIWGVLPANAIPPMAVNNELNERFLLDHMDERGIYYRTATTEEMAAIVQVPEEEESHES